jgi:hypothetical protein
VLNRMGDPILEKGGYFSGIKCEGRPQGPPILAGRLKSTKSNGR